MRSPILKPILSPLNLPLQPPAWRLPRVTSSADWYANDQERNEARHLRLRRGPHRFPHCPPVPIRCPGRAGDRIPCRDFGHPIDEEPGGASPPETDHGPGLHHGRGHAHLQEQGHQDPPPLGGSSIASHPGKVPELSPDLGFPARPFRENLWLTCSSSRWLSISRWTPLHRLRTRETGSTRCGSKSSFP